MRNRAPKIQKVSHKTARMIARLDAQLRAEFGGDFSYRIYGRGLVVCESSIKQVIRPETIFSGIE